MADYEDKEQKTEEATPRRRDEARNEGQVAISSELMAALGLCVGMGVLALAGGQLAHASGLAIVQTIGSLGDLGTSDLDLPLSVALVRESVTSTGEILLVVILPAILVAGLAGYLQVGFRFAPKAIEFNPTKIDPVKGLKRFFSMRSVVRTVMAAAKVLCITLVVGVIACLHLGDVVNTGTSELGPLLVSLGHIALRCTAGALVVIVLLAVADLAFQRYQHSRDLRMTKQELKEEHRLTDGDPHVRARIRQIQRDMATKRMMAEVPEATVVVTNPTHYAVALRYEQDDPDSANRAPVVVAKGADHVAQRIKAIAEEHGVARHEDVQLARALHAQVEVGQEIPEELYAAVATVLGQVYRLRQAVSV